MVFSSVWNYSLFKGVTEMIVEEVFKIFVRLFIAWVTFLYFKKNCLIDFFEILYMLHNVYVEKNMIFGVHCQVTKIQWLILSQKFQETLKNARPNFSEKKQLLFNVCANSLHQLNKIRLLYKISKHAAKPIIKMISSQREDLKVYMLLKSLRFLNKLFHHSVYIIFLIYKSKNTNIYIQIFLYNPGDGSG